MKNRSLKLLPLIIVLPTLMGNAPAPQVFTQTYKDYQLTYLNVEQDGEYYLYHYNLKNIGNGYISSLYIKEESKDDYFVGSLFSGGNYRVYPFFGDGLFQPGFDDEIVFRSLKEANNINKVSVDCVGYNTFDPDVTISGTQQLSLYRKEDQSINLRCYYKLDVSLEYQNDSDWNYGVVANINYDGNTYYIKIDARGGFIVETSQELDLTKLTINDLTVIKSHSYGYGCRGNAQKIMIIFLVIVFIFALMISFGIFAAIFFPAMARRRRRRRQAAKK